MQSSLSISRLHGPQIVQAHQNFYLSGIVPTFRANGHVQLIGKTFCRGKISDSLESQDVVVMCPAGEYVWAPSAAGPRSPTLHACFNGGDPTKFVYIREHVRRASTSNFAGLLPGRPVYAWKDSLEKAG